MALSSWPSVPHTWLLPWAIWRFNGSPVGQRPAGVPKTIPPYAWEFLKWAAWRRKGALPPRPDIAPKIPKWGWDLLKQLNIAVPIVPPPPPPPPPNPLPPNSWKLPGPVLFTSWGWMTDSAWRDTDVGLQKAYNAGVKTIALQGGLFRAQDPDRCRSYGFKVAVWGSPHLDDGNYIAQAQADGYIPQIEGDEEFANAVRNLSVGIGDGLSISFVTTFHGLDTFTSRPDGTVDGHPTTEEVEQLASLGCTHALVECYTGDMQPRDVSQLMFTGSMWRGIYYSNPVIGLARDTVYVSDYKPGIDPYGRQIGIYLAEPMRDIDWYAIKNL